LDEGAQPVSGFSIIRSGTKSFFLKTPKGICTLRLSAKVRIKFLNSRYLKKGEMALGKKVVRIRLLIKLRFSQLVILSGAKNLAISGR
jgi:hypothetical protein